MADKDGYPTEAELKLITEWDVINDVKGLIEFIKEQWIYEEYFKYEPPLLELHTGGWSGHESVIGALERNLIFWGVFWQKSERGGHYYFEIKEG
jgi:hypothetical protein